MDDPNGVEDAFLSFALLSFFALIVGVSVILIL